LQFLIAHHVAGGVLHSALGLVCHAFDMFLVYDRLLGRGKSPAQAGGATRGEVRTVRYAKARAP
jgi:hypothetical protein